MKEELTYDGQKILWDGKGTFKATSGMPKSQMPKNQCIPDAGPVPEGMYYVYLSDHGLAEDDGRGLCAIKPSWGIQKIPRGKDAGDCEIYWANWGKNRARMEPANAETKAKCNPIKRGGFYLHDSTKGYSHGCIEVESSIFSKLHEYRNNSKKSKIILKVKYVKGVSTYGGTKI